MSFSTSTSGTAPLRDLGSPLGLLGRGCRGFFRFCFSRKMLWLILCLLGLLVIAWQIENWRGEKAWATTQAEMARRGYTLDEVPWPADVPDDQNIAMHPVFAPALTSQFTSTDPNLAQRSYDFTRIIATYPVKEPMPQIDGFSPPDPITFSSFSDKLPGSTPEQKAGAVLEATQVLDPFISGINEAFQRPSCQWAKWLDPTARESYPSRLPIPILSGLYESMVYFRTHLGMRIEAELTLQKLDSARESMLALIHFARICSQKERISLVSVLVDVALSGLLPDGLENVCSHPQWRGSDLAMFQKALAGTDLPGHVHFGLRREMLFSMREILGTGEDSSFARSIRQSGWSGLLRIPDGWRKQNAATHFRLNTRYYLDVYDTEHRVFDRQASFTFPPELQSITPYNVLSAIATPAISNVYVSAIESQMRIERINAKWAQRQHVLANGKPAENWDQLVPTYLSEIPHDYYSGRKLAVSEF